MGVCSVPIRGILLVHVYERGGPVTESNRLHCVTLYRKIGGTPDIPERLPPQIAGKADLPSGC